MNEWMNLLLASIPITGDEANPNKWIWIMVVVGVLLVVLAVVSVVMSKKKNAADIEDKTSDKKEE